MLRSRNNVYMTILTYTQIIVGSGFLFSSCNTEVNLKNHHLQDLITAVDERNFDEVLPYLKDKDPAIRKEAAWRCASFNDSLIVDSLFSIFDNEPEVDIRASLAFSIGQCTAKKSSYILIQKFRSESDLSVRAELLKALGKSGQTNWLSLQKDSIDSALFPALAEGLFYAIRATKKAENSIKTLLYLILQEQPETRFYASSALSRTDSIPSKNQTILKNQLEKEQDEATRSVLYKCIGKCGTSQLIYLKEHYPKEDNYLIRLAILKSVSNWKPEFAAPIIQLGLNDTNFHIRETASNWCLQNASIFPTSFIVQLARVESFPRAKYLLLQSLLKSGNAILEDSLSALLIKQLQAEKDEYIVGYIVKALAEDISNFSLLEELTFSTPSILVREFGFEALLQIRSSDNFKVYSTEWQQKTKSPISLEQYFAKLIKNAMETHDVSLIAIASAFLRDETVSGTSNAKITVPYSDIRFMKDAMQLLKLPRDIESYTELKKTIQYYEGKSSEISLKPDYNNPINWDLVSRIPGDQHIQFITSEGTIECELWVKEAPGTVGQFVRLIQEEFYRNKRIHRVVPGFVIQDGCPRGDGFGSLMETIRTEISQHTFEAGTLGMASSGMDTESCQWFITHTRTPHLNGRYTAFGRVTHGMDVVHKLAIGAKVEAIRLVD
jgi:cyclophilin family peptidyl-prolyl cis-trans isomerase